MTPKERAAMQQALSTDEALMTLELILRDGIEHGNWPLNKNCEDGLEAITALREALAGDNMSPTEQAQQETEDLDWITPEAVFEAKLKLHGITNQPVKQAEQEPVSWIYEDELPKGYPYDEMFSRSKIIEGVRMFPEVQTEQSTVKDSLTAQDHIRDATKMVAEQAEQDHFAASGKPIVEQERMPITEPVVPWLSHKVAEQAEQEPVGYFAYDEEHDIWEELTGPNAPGATPLYTALQPVKQEPVAWWNGKETAWFEHELCGWQAPDGCTIPLYAAPVSAEAIRAEALEQAEERVTELYTNMEFPFLPDITAAIRGLK